MERNRLEEIFIDEQLFDNIPVTVKRQKGIFKTVVEDTYLIPALFVVSDGVYVFIDEKKYAVSIYNQILRKLKINRGLYVFIYENGNGVYYDDKTSSYVEFEDFYEGVITFRQNHMIPEAVKSKYKFNCAGDYFEDVYYPEEDAEDMYVRPVHGEKTIDKIIDILIDMEDEPIVSGDYLIYPDGNVKVKRTITNGMKISEGIFPCSDAETSGVFWVTVLGGWLGLHKFRERKWLQGIFYLLTCGMFGVFYVGDILAILSGTYCRVDNEYSRFAGKISKTTTKTFLRPFDKKFYHYLMLPAAIIFALLFIRFVYMPGITLLSLWMSEAISSLIVNNKGLTDAIGSAATEIPLK